MNSRFSSFVLIGILGCYGPTIPALTCVAAQTDSRDLRVQANSQIERRVALVIGNATYKDAPLRNPVNDARAMAQALRDLGFDVLYAENLSQNDMKRNIGTFGERIRNGGVGLFYYAGHGVQVRGRNYLIPVGATITSEDDIEYESVDVGRVLEKMANAHNRLNIVILDACRNNPFARGFRSIQNGLVAIDASYGTLIAYATAPGEVASDGTEENGLYTQQLLKYMRVPELRIEQVFKQVRVAVRRQTAGKQTPWESSSLEGDFYFSSSATPTTAVAHVKLGDKLADTNQWAEAEAHYRQSMRLEPQNAVCLHKLYISFIRQKKGAESRDALRQLNQMKKWGEIEAEHRQATGREPQNANSHMALGNALTHERKLAEAESELRQVIKIDPSDAIARTGVGVVLAHQEKFSEAEAEYRQAIKIDPNYSHTHANLGRTLAGMKRYEEAEAEFRRAISIDPTDSEAHSGLGITLFEQRKYAESEAEFRQAIKIDPGYPNAHGVLGTALANQQKYPQAETEFREALIFDPNNASAHVGLGNALSYQQKYQEAEGEFKEAIKLDPNNAMAYYYRGNALSNQRRYAEAEAEYREAIRIRPNSPNFYNNLGNVLLNQHRYREAEAECRQAIKLFSNHAVAHNNLGYALANQQKYVEAEAEYRQALKIDPNYALAQTNLTKLLEARPRPLEQPSSQEQRSVEGPKKPAAEYTVKKTVTVLFATGKSELTSQTTAALDELVRQINDRNSFLLEIQGFDEFQTDVALSERLSQARAVAVRAYLTESHNIPLFRISVLGMGQSHPVGDNRTSDGRRQNRRVEVRLLTNN